jgi:hypothetical protein
MFDIKQLILESTFISIYTLLIKNYLGINKIFLLGFLKHFLSGILGLHYYYCSIKSLDIKYIFNIQRLIIESILEGLLFHILYFNIFKNIIETHENVNIFLMTFLLHISFEFLGIHKLFCLF